MTDSLVLGNSIELLGGGVVSVNPLCAGASFKLRYGGDYDLGAPQPTSNFVASLILDGERPFGRRSSNRAIKLPVVITAPTRKILAAAREVLEQVVDQDVWTITWTRDAAGGTPLPLIIDCFRAQPSVPTYDLITEQRGFAMQLELTIPALPYGRSDVQQQIAFASPVPQTPPPPPAPVVIDTFSSISSSQHFQSTQCIVGPRSCGWDPDDGRVGDPGGQSTPFVYTAALSTPLNLTGMTSVAMWLGFGSRYYTNLEYHGKTHGVNVFITLTDTSGGTLGMSRAGLRLAASPVAQTPVFSRVSMPIPQGTSGFNYASVGGYTLTIINRNDRVRRLSWVTAYVDALTAYPPSQTSVPVVRGSLYTLYGLQGTARAAASLSFQQPPTAGTPTTVTSAGVGNYTVPVGAAWLKVEGIGGGGAGASLTTTGNGGGGGGGAYAAEPLFACTPGQVIPYNVGAGGTAGATPVDGGSTVFGPGPSSTMVVTALGGASAAQNSSAGGAGGAAGLNSARFAGGTGRTASGSVGGGGGSSAGNSSAGLSPTGTAATVFTSPGTTTWTCPAGVTQVFAECWGSGGSGATGNSGNGGGGGGGEYAAQFVAVTPGNNYSYTVAAGGATSSGSAVNGHAGASSTFAGDSVTVTAHGGAAGTFQSHSGGGGSGGSGSSNTVNFPGGAGGPAFPYSGSGGSSAGTAAAGQIGNGYGNAPAAPTGGGAGGAGTGANSGANGSAGAAPGGGGGGCFHSTTSGAGAAGQVRLTFPGGAPTNNGAAAVTGGGAGGAGGPSANTAGSAGSAPGGAGGGACSTGTAEAGGAGAAGQLIITPFSSAPFKSLIVHRPPLGALKTFVPLVSVGAGADAPDGTHQYAIPQPVTGVNADFSGTYTLYLIANSLNGSSARTITVTVTQFEYAGGPSYAVSTLPVTVTPAQLANGILTAGVLTLPLKAVASDNANGYYSVTVTDTNTADRWNDLIFLDTQGQTVVINGTGSGYINYYLDAPEPNLDLGLVMGSSQGRPSAISVFDICQAISGGAMSIEPADGENQLFAYSADALAPNISVSYYPNWFFDRFQ
jgi:hypothetical protein